MSSKKCQFQIGHVVRVEGLTSLEGKTLNHKPAILVDWDSTLERWKCRVQDNTRANLSGIQERRLCPLEPRPLPTNKLRGITMATHSPWEKAETLVDLLVSATNRYTPPDTMLMGEAGMAFMRLGQDNFVAYTTDQMEHLAGVLALRGMCREGKQEAVLFALLEADPMTLEWLITTMTWTPLIGPEETMVHEDLRNFYDTDFTPDQEHDVYVHAMLNGPVGLLTDMVDYRFGKALFAALGRCKNSVLLVRRLFRWMAREGMKKKDGLKLGKVARKICEAILQLKGSLPVLSMTEGEQLLMSESKLTTLNVARVFAQNVLIDNTKPGG